MPFDLENRAVKGGLLHAADLTRQHQSDEESQEQPGGRGSA